MFWETLFQGWVVARQTAGQPAAETIRLIMNWKAQDQYGFMGDFEHIEAGVSRVELTFDQRARKRLKSISNVEC